MSREESGEAPAEVELPSDRTLARLAAFAPPGRAARWVVAARSGSGRTLLIAGCALVGLLVGWGGVDAWPGTPEPAAARAQIDVSALVTDVNPDGSGSTRSLADFRVLVRNAGTALVTVVDTDVTWDAAAVTGLVPRRLPVAPGTSEQLLLHVSIACASPQPLRLPPLRMRAADGSMQPLIVDGSAAMLSRLCQQALADVHLLELTDPQPDGQRFRFLLRAPTGRTTRINQIRAAGVALDASLPLSVDGEARVVWLDRPASCDPAWSANGIPRQLTIDVDAGGPSTVELTAGYAFTRWLLDGPCSARTS